MIRIRRFQPADEPAIRELCFATALYGQPMAPFFDDARFVTDAWVRDYVRYESAWCWVAEAEGRVVGYLTGTPDTERFVHRFRRGTLWRLMGRFLVKGHWRRPAVRQLLHAFATGRARISPRRAVLLRDYPAHFHFNLADGFRGQGVGSEFLKTFLEALRTHGIGGLHAGVGTTAGQRALVKEGFRELDRFPALPIGPNPPAEIVVLGKTL